MSTLTRAITFIRTSDQVRQLIIFGVIGVAATATHVSLALLSRAVLGLQPLAANGVGYICAFSISYFGNAWLTFRRPALHGPQFLRYLGVSLAGLALSEALTYLCTAILKWPFALALVPIVTLVPLLSFVLSRKYAFATPPAEGRAAS